MKVSCYVGVFCILASSTVFGDETCDVLSKGNKYYSSGEYSQSLNIYKTIEEIDKLGKGVCTSSIYATIATIYTIYGDKEMVNNTEKASLYYKTASKYNRAFAYAIDCHLRSCVGSKNFWGGKE